MMELLLPMPPSVNNLVANVRGKGRVDTANYKAWKGHAGWALRAQKATAIVGAVEVELYFGKDTNADLDNLTKAPLDLLVRHRIIPDDRRKFVRKVTLSWDDSIEGCRVVVRHAAKGEGA